MLKDHILIDIILGLLLFSTWLNIKNGNLQLLTDYLTEEIRVALIGLLIIFSPLLFECLFNIENILGITQESTGSKSSTFLIASISAMLTVFIRESIIDFKEVLEKKELIFGELYQNYQSLQKFLKDEEMLKNGGVNDANIIDVLWNQSALESWSSNIYINEINEIKRRKIYKSEISDEISKIYQDINVIISRIKNKQGSQDYFRKSLPDILNNIENTLKEMDYHKASHRLK